jgi:hypothetical protein
LPSRLRVLLDFEGAEVLGEAFIQPHRDLARLCMDDLVHVLVEDHTVRIVVAGIRRQEDVVYVFACLSNRRPPSSCLREPAEVRRLVVLETMTTVGIGKRSSPRRPECRTPPELLELRADLPDGLSLALPTSVKFFDWTFVHWSAK